MDFVSNFWPWIWDTGWARSLFFGFLCLSILLLSWKIVCIKSSELSYKNNFKSTANLLFLTEEMINQTDGNVYENSLRIHQLLKRQFFSIRTAAQKSAEAENLVWFERLSMCVDTVPQIAILFTAYTAVSKGGDATGPVAIGPVVEQLFKNLAVGIALYILFLMLLSLFKYIYLLVLEKSTKKWTEDCVLTLCQEYVDEVCERSMKGFEWKRNGPAKRVANSTLIMRMSILGEGYQKIDEVEINKENQEKELKTQLNELENLLNLKRSSKLN